ncbi:hypothetical protein [Halomicrobium salinisoli]|uniref:hypothetical protein n=1 Tax=Halomicrobium salinisoli TaxID=2878391 RepID=UPI001CEFF41F|nr:hypothetical protein [Halomicrobium salinisoli]
MIPRDATRRRFLATGAAVAVAASAGCQSLSTSDDDGADGDAQRTLHLRLIPWDGTLRDRYVVDLSETRPDWDEQAFEATLDGEAYTTQYRKPFLTTDDDPTYAKRADTYYHLGSVVVDEATATHPVLRLSEVTDGDDSSGGAPADSSGDASVNSPGDGSTATSADATDADRLPESDQRAVHIAHMATRARGNVGGVPWGLVERGGYVYRSEEAIEASQLLAEDGPDRVTYRETEYAVDVAEERFHEPVYRATVQPVATSPEQMEAILRAKLVDARLAETDLSEDAREILWQARGDGEGYGEPHPFSQAYRAVLRALDERAYVDGNVEKDAFTDDHGRGTLLYDGDYFDYRLRFSDDSA